MNIVQAHAIRRGAMAAAAVAATLGAHALSGADMAVNVLAPATWLTLVLLSMLAFPRRGGEFSAWGPLRIGMTLALSQVAIHVVMHAAPWLFGFVGHAHEPMITPVALVAHGVAAVLLTVGLCFGQRLLERAVRVVRRLWLAVARRTGPPRAAARVLPTCLRIAGSHARAPRTSRGPPAVVVAA